MYAYVDDYKSYIKVNSIFMNEKMHNRLQNGNSNIILDDRDLMLLFFYSFVNALKVN